MRRNLLAFAAAGAFVTGSAACGSSASRPPGITLGTDSFRMVVSTDSAPPIAEENTRFKLVVRDRETGQPVDVGEGRIFASNKDGLKVNDGLAKGKEVGTYYANIMFPISGEWAIAVQFRRDSTKNLERDDWQMTVRPAKPGYGS